MSKHHEEHPDYGAMGVFAGYGEFEPVTTSILDNSLDSPRVRVYTSGLCYCSACAPAELDAKTVEQEVNQSNPTGISSRWKIADEPFKGGEPNPCQCNDGPERKHWLLVC